MSTTSPDETIDAELVDDQGDQGDQLERPDPLSSKALAVRQPAGDAQRRDLRSTVTDSWTSVVQDVAWLANMIAGSDFVPDAYQGKPGQVAATILHGRELGLGPMTALSTTNPIHGKPAISAEAMRALVMQAGHEIRFVESSGTRCVAEGRRTGVDDWTRVEWTMADVQRAKIRNSNYQTYPRQMLQARASVELCRMIFPDVIHGLRATEELADELEAVGPASAAAAAEQPKTTPVQRKGTRKPAASSENTPSATPNADPERATVGEQSAAPARKRAARPAPRSRADSREPATDAQQSGDSGTASTVEEQQAEIRELSQERRDLAADARGGVSPGTGRGSRPGDNPNEAPAESTAEVPAEDTPAAPTVTNSGRDTGPELSAPQRVQILRHFDRLEIADRDERLWWTNKLAGLAEGTLVSTNALKFTEARNVINRLERFRNRDELDSALNGQDELLGGAE